MSGPSEAYRIYSTRIDGKGENYFGTNYMGKFLALMEQFRAEVWIETWHGAGSEHIRQGSFTFNNDPPPAKGGIRYHLGQIYRQIRLIVRLMKFRPEILMLTGHQEYWWLYGPLKLTGARFVATIHGALWPPLHPLQWHQKLFRRLNAIFAYPLLDAAVVTSHVIGRQLLQELGSQAGRLPLYHHLPTYDPAQFEKIDSPTRNPSEPFRVFFSGRVIENKGVFDLLEMAARLEKVRPGEFLFDVCGDGPDLARLETAIVRRNLSHVISCHGYCGPEKMREVMGLSHAVVVPTRAEVPAGFEMTCVEAVLSGRPLIASAACPALEYLRQASIEVQVDDVDDYVRALEQLKDAPMLYQGLRDRCADLGKPFFRYEKSWDHAMRLALARFVGVPTQ